VLEWHAHGQAASLSLEWVVGPDPGTAPKPGTAAEGVPPAVPGPWRRAERGLLVAHGNGFLAAFVFSAAPDDLTVEPEPAGLRVRARAALAPGESLRLALAIGAGAAELERGLRAAGRSRALVQARRGAMEQLRVDRLSVITPDAAVDRALEWAKVRLAARLVESPGAGRSIASSLRTGGPGYVTADAVQGSLDALSTGDFDAARDVLAFLHRHQHRSGQVPDACDLHGRTDHGDSTAAMLYLQLVTRFLDAAGDAPFLQAEGPAIRRAWEFVRDAADTSGALVAAAGHGLTRVAEAIGDAAMAAAIRRVVEGASVDHRDRTERAPAGARPASHDPTGVIPFLRRVTGAEPDATRGRLVLRPRPPRAWDHFQATALAMGESRFTLEYRRQGPVHRFSVRQDRGAAPVRLILEPELPGRLVTARVDGEAAELDPLEADGRTRVPVQLALDHQRSLELEMQEVGRSAAKGQTKTPDG
jgi:hypothetical protein